MSEITEPLFLDSTGQKIIEAINAINSRIDDNEVTKFNTYSAKKIEQMFENASDETEVEELKTDVETLQTDIGTIQTDVDSLKTSTETLTSNLKTTDENVTKNASDIENLSKSSHSHENLSILNNLTQSVIDNSHTHDNSDVLDKLGESDDGNLLFDGKEIKGGGGGSLNIPPKNPTNVSIKATDETLRVSWTDPEDNIVEGTTLASWGGTILIINPDNAPVDEKDGTVVVNNTTHNAYATTPLEITGLENNKTYYLYFVPYTTAGTYGYSDDNRYTGMPAKVFLNDVTGVTTEAGDKTLKVTWTNPEQTKTENDITAMWAKTTVVVKADSYPASETDGIAYESTDYSEGEHEFEVENGHDYYVRFFVESDLGSVKQTDVEDSIATYATVIVSTDETTLYGKEVKLTWTDENEEEQTLTGTLDANEKPAFKVPYMGEVSFYSTDGDEEATDSLSVEAWTNYEVELSFAQLVPFATATDEELTKMIDAYYKGKFSLEDVKTVWSVGDARVIDLEAMAATGVGETHVAQSQKFTILDFDHDDLVDIKGTKTKALITVQQLNTLSNGTTQEGGYMNSSNTNTNGWDGSARRTWCNSVYYNALPSAIKSLVKQVTKQNYKVYNSTTLTTTNDYAFLPSETEIFAAKAYSAGNTEGTQYSYYATAANRIKYAGNASATGSAAWWWERSPRSDSAAPFCDVGASGAAGSAGATYAGGCAPCLCF